MNKDIIIHLAGYCQPLGKDNLMKLNTLFHETLKDRKLVIQTNPNTIRKSHQVAAFYEYIDDYAMLEFLLKNNISPNVFNILDMTPFHYALINNNKKIVALLCHYGANINEPLPLLHPIHLAVYNHDVNLVTLLIKDLKCLNVQTKLGETPLLIAIKQRCTDIMMLLVNAGAGVNIADHNGITPSHLLTKRGDINGLRLLMNHGADINKQTIQGYNCIDYAILHKKIEIVKVLLNKGGDIGIKSTNQYTSLMVAACVDDVLILKLILDKNPSLINHENRYGWTALCWSVYHNKMNNVKYLLSCGATTHLNIKLVDRNVKVGQTLLDIARDKNYINIISLLEAAKNPKTAKTQNSISDTKHRCVIQ